MRLRRRCLPEGWYPRNRTDTVRSIDSLSSSVSIKKKPCRAGIVPHAGWDFSGKAALSVVLSVEEPVDTCVVIGGHLPPGSGVFAAYEDAYETPLGPLSADLDLLADLKSLLPLQEDATPDNTVEIQLPFVRFAFPDARALWLRAAPSDEAPALGRALYRLARDSGKRILVLGSTDLTHYGPDYGFTSQGRGEKAHQWVKEVNDKKIIDAFLKLDLAAALAAAREDASACSAGGAAAAAGYAGAWGVTTGTLLTYYTSYDIFPHNSFVGYAGIVY
jgi:AmmeMemoRadiSam system protein B